MLEAEIQIKHGAEFRRCLIEMDIDGMMRLWKHCAPHLADTNRKACEMSMHLARTKMETLPIKLKVYSQNWLNERGVGSFLADDVRQKGGLNVKARV